MRRIALKDYYNNLARKEKADLRKAICEVLKLEYHSYMYRLRENAWSELERNNLRDYLKNSGYEQIEV